VVAQATPAARPGTRLATAPAARAPPIFVIPTRIAARWLARAVVAQRDSSAALEAMEG